MRVLALLILTTVPAAALVPDPLCHVDEATGTIWPTQEARGSFAVWPAVWPGEVVTFDWIDAAGQVHGFVQLCQTNAALRWSIDTAGEESMRPRLHAMLESDTVYSLGDIGRMIRGLGGRAARAQSPGSCACDTAGF